MLPLTGYQTKKWLNPDVYPETEGWNHDACGSAMRFTEVLLMYAEALNEMSDRPQESLDAVNRVRARVGMPALQKTDASLPTYVGSQGRTPPAHPQRVPRRVLLRG